MKITKEHLANTSVKQIENEVEDKALEQKTPEFLHSFLESVFKGNLSTVEK